MHRDIIDKLLSKPPASVTAALWFAIYCSVATSIFLLGAVAGPRGRGDLQSDLDSHLYSVDLGTYCTEFATLPSIVGLVIAIVGRAKVRKLGAGLSPDIVQSWSRKASIRLIWLGILVLLSLLGVPVVRFLTD